MNVPPEHPARLRRNAQNALSAFTLIEVMIAIGVFCIGVFFILELVASVLHGARLLDKPMVDAGVVASEIGNTNQLIEVEDVSGDLSEFLGKNYQGYTYDYSITEVQSNRLFELDVFLRGNSGSRPLISKMAVLLYRPASPPGKLDGGMNHR
jgi:prepilin-type N-terminal cleavage/methylation domain-containing protein